MNPNGVCVGYKKFFKVDTEQERLEVLYKNLGCLKKIVDCTKVNFSNEAVQLFDRTTKLNKAEISDNVCLFYMGSEYVVPELRGLHINSTLSKKTFDNVFSSINDLLSQKTQIGFAYCLSAALDYDDQGNGKSRTSLILELFLNCLRSYFVIGHVKLYRFVTWMSTFDKEGNLVQDSSASVKGYGNLCIIEKKITDA